VRAALLTLAAILIVAAAFTQKVSDKMPDFEVYWTAAVRARAAEPLYRAEDAHFQFKYLPAFAVLAIPIGFLPLPAAKAVWFTTSVALLVILIASGIRMLPEIRRPRWFLVAAAVVVMGKFYGHELVLGQVNLLLGVLVGAAVVLLRGRHEAAAGALLAAAVIVKPYAVIFLPWLAARRRVASIGAATGGLLFALLLPTTIYGVDGNVRLLADWWRTVAGSTAPNLLNNDNVSAAAMWAKWLGPGDRAAWLATATGLLLLGAAALVHARRADLRFPEGLEAAFLLTLIPLLSPQGWDYVFLLATPAVLILTNYSEEFRPSARAVLVAALLTIGLSLFDVMGRATYARFMALSIISVCFLIVVTMLAILRLRRIA
jgi:Glycosyltransferase family 87